MSIRFVRGAGTVADPSAFNFAASGVVKVNQAVELSANGTGGAVVAPATSSTTGTMIFGVSMGYAQGASDTFVPVIPFDDNQYWEVDCANIATTAQLGIRHALSGSDRSVIHNTATDIGANVAVATRATGIFLAIAMTSLTTGSGKLIGKFLPNFSPVPGPSGQI